jgi:DNA mismatch repair protein MSH2
MNSKTLVPVSFLSSFWTSAYRFPGDKETEQIPQDVIEEGVKIMEEVFRSWATPNKDGEDVVMGEADDDDPEQQLEKLKACMQTFAPRIQNNPWIQSVLNSL